MRTIGRRKQRELSVYASGEQLKQGALFNDEMHKLPTGQRTAMPKGVYRYATHEEANLHWLESLVKFMVHYAQ
ncbi:MAG: hypothetical protein QG652_629 [Pseudomonadota bacterium]|nr:hypothetical protein [Pseudomonadota bacterium]